MDTLTHKAQFCRRLIVSAGKQVMQAFGHARELARKGPQDYLTETDGLCEAFIRSQLQAVFPEDSFFGEESGGQATGNVWVVDPIDGTANFARNIPHFCIAIAYVSQGTVQLGAIYCPPTQELYFAQAGQGASLNGQPIHVSETRDVAGCSVELGWSTRMPRQTYLDTLTALLDQGFNVRRAGSGALGLAYVAAGRSDAYAEAHMNAWDCLAGLLLVKEAGGRVSPYLDSPDLPQGGAVLATSPALADIMSSCTGIRICAPDQSDRAHG